MFLYIYILMYKNKTMVDYNNFTSEFKNISNLDLASYKDNQMQRRIENFIQKKIGEINYIKFLNEIKYDHDLYEAFLEHITINVTEFFRNPDTWDVLVKNIIPEIIKDKNSINIWSCGCSTGEEPYTLAMLIKQNYPNIKANILATDLDKKVISIAKNGVYDISSMKSMPKLYKDKYFSEVAYSSCNKHCYSISEEIKSMVTFKNHNLLSDKFPNNIDLIVCRNVIIYFKENAKTEIYQNFYNSLSDNGYLFVGNTEHIVNYKDFNFLSTNCFFFKKDKNI